MKLGNHTDVELMHLLTAGDENAFSEIYERHALSLYRYVCGRIKNGAESEEIIQEIFLWLWQKRTTLGHVDQLKAYLFAAARHKIASHLSRSVLQEKYAQHYALFSVQYDNSVNELSDVSDFQTLLEKSIASLPPNCQTAFRLSRLEHMSIANIAKRMNLSTGTVENYISQALKHLRTAWQKHFRLD